MESNGNASGSPPWPNPQLKNEKIFILPKKLDINDTIVITGTTYDQRKRLTIGLVTGLKAPDHSNVACQLDVNFYDPNNIVIQAVKDGSPVPVSVFIEKSATAYFKDPLSFQVKFKVRCDEKEENIVVDVHVGDSYLTTLNLEHKFEVNGIKYEIKYGVNTIRFLAVYGDFKKVSRLDFNFG